MRARSIKFAALLLASAAALALPSASFGQTNDDVEYWRRYLLGSGRYELMQICDWGRRWNRQGNSFFDGNVLARRSQSFKAGVAAAMFEVCPDVR